MRTDRLSENKIFIIKIVIPVFLFLFFKGWFLVHDYGVDELSLTDPDCYMRLVRVQSLYDNGEWFNNTISRSNSPLGETLHWSRPLDILLFVGAYVGSFFLSFRDALYWWGYILSPVIMVSSVLALEWAGRPLFSKGLRVWMIAFFLCQAAVAFVYAFGRPDHHSLLALLFVLQIGFVLRIIFEDERERRYPYFAGFITAVSMWVSVETLASFFLITGTFGILWIAKSRRYIQSLQLYVLALVIFSLLFLFAERSLSDIMKLEYDKLSIVHVVSFALAWLMLRAAMLYKTEQTRDKCFVAILLFPFTLVCLVSLFPNLLKGPYATVDPRVIPIWLSRVYEIQPLSLATRLDVVKSVVFLGSVFWALPCILLPLVDKRKSTPQWIFFTLGVLIFVGLSIYQVRWSFYAEIILLFPMAYVLCIYFERIKKIQKSFLQSIARILVILSFAVGHYLVAWSVNDPQLPASTPQFPPVHRLSAFLNHREYPLTILAEVNLGPQLLYETKHNVIATPYHRNSAGILFWYDVMMAETDEDARQLLHSRRVDLIVVCPQGTEVVWLKETGERNVFYNRLMANQSPAWLRPIELPSEMKSSFLIYQVIGGVE